MNCSSKFFVFCILLTSMKLANAIDCDKVIATIDINQCAHNELQKVEKQLNETYQRVLKGLPTSDGPGTDSINPKHSLVVAQRAWVSFREADCDAVFDFWASGTIRTVQRISCMQNHAELRIRQLRQYEERR